MQFAKLAEKLASDESRDRMQFDAVGLPPYDLIVILSKRFVHRLSSLSLLIENNL